MQLPDFTRNKLLIAGDVMLDRYWHGSTRRISPEAPVPVVNVRHIEHRAGGAANVAFGVAALGAQARLLGTVGADEAATELARLIEQAGIDNRLHVDQQRPTITKLRVVSQHQQMIRLDFEAAASAEAALPETAFRQSLVDIDALILSDYGKGALSQVQRLIQLARQADIPVLVDPKQADFEVYRNATLLTPNRREFERVVGPCKDTAELVEKGMRLAAELGCSALLITRGEEGMTLLSKDSEPVHIPAQAQEVFDVTGAGDTVIAVLASAVAAGMPLAEAAHLANIAAGIAVGKLGTATVTKAELDAALSASAKTADSRRGIVAENELLQYIALARQRGERIVMTNGCFDLLHPGHISYLEKARQFGDRLIIAVNDDDSVQRLKGDKRPINPLAHRMAVLAGLAAVDWVVAFSEDTPARLIAAAAPDVLVKGGDYQVEQIAGHEAVLARGGQVKILPFVDHHSTTAIINRILRPHG